MPGQAQLSPPGVMPRAPQDCESNGGNPKYAPELLMDVMGGKVDGGPAVAPVAK